MLWGVCISAFIILTHLKNDLVVCTSKLSKKVEIKPTKIILYILLVICTFYMCPIHLLSQEVIYSIIAKFEVSKVVTFKLFCYLLLSDFFLLQCLSPNFDKSLEFQMAKFSHLQMTIS